MDTRKTDSINRGFENNLSFFPSTENDESNDNLDSSIDLSSEELPFDTTIPPPPLNSDTDCACE